MTFMELQAQYFKAYIVETNQGTEIVPADLIHYDDSLQDDYILGELYAYCEGQPQSYEIETGWYSRLSAPGYMDRTDWMGPFKTQSQAENECKQLYGDDDNG